MLVLTFKISKIWPPTFKILVKNVNVGSQKVDKNGIFKIKKELCLWFPKKLFLLFLKLEKMAAMFT